MIINFIIIIILAYLCSNLCGLNCKVFSSPALSVLPRETFPLSRTLVNTHTYAHSSPRNYLYVLQQPPLPLDADHQRIDTLNRNQRVKLTTEPAGAAETAEPGKRGRAGQRNM